MPVEENSSNEECCPDNCDCISDEDDLEVTLGFLSTYFNLSWQSGAHYICYIAILLLVSNMLFLYLVFGI